MTEAVQIEHTTIHTNGVNLHVAQAGSDADPLVILLHGFPDFWYGWRAQITYLAEHGYRVWAPDQRGYNLSDKPAGIASYRIETLVQDVIGLIDASGRDKVYLVGHDWGAMIAWTLAITFPERLHKLAILNVPHPVVFQEMLRTNIRQMLKSWYVGFFQIPLLPETLLTLGDAMFMANLLFASSSPGTFDDAAIREYTRAWQQPGAMTAMINWYRASLRYPPAPPADPRVHIPTLVIWGAQDVALSRDLVQPSVDMCDDARLVWFEQSSHWVQDEETHQVNALLAKFLQPR